MSDRTRPVPSENPSSLVAAALAVAVQGLVLLGLAVLELASLSSARAGLGLSTTAFFAAYAAVLIAAAAGLWRRSSWARGPVLITQLILLGLAWSLREHALVAAGMALCAVAVIAAMVHPDTLRALEGEHAGDTRD